MSIRNYLESLPVDVLERIVSYLSVNDLSKCCAASKSWRQVFSDDIFWKKQCTVEPSDYLEKSESHVKPHFFSSEVQPNLEPFGTWKMRFLREQHLWKNWQSGRYSREEIEFDCDDSISYNIKTEFVANNYVFLHTTFNTEVYDVSRKPQSILTIPFYLNEMWENNLYKVIENKLVVVQSNVVQVFDINLDSKQWSFDKVFFFDRPEEFSSVISEETNIDELYQETSSDIGDDVEHVICGDFFVGVVTNKESLKTPVLHIWNLKTGKKIKEEMCLKYFEAIPTHLYVENSETSAEEIVVLSKIHRKRRFSVYSLNKLKFLTTAENETGDSLLLYNYLCTFSGSDVKILKFNTDSGNEDVQHTFPLEFLNCWHAINKKILIASNSELILVNPDNATIDFRTQIGFDVGDFHVVKSRFVIFNDRGGNAREVWEAGKEFKKLFSFPPNTETYRVGNDVCSKLLLERTNKLIVLNFW